MSLGATLLQTAKDPAADGEVFQMYADPAGHPFCLCRGPLPEWAPSNRTAATARPATIRSGRIDLRLFAR